MKTIKSFFLAALAILLVAESHAQIAMPAPSPTATLEQKIGLTDFTVVYSRPSMKGRAIFGELVPFGEVWRTGANEPTKLTFGDAVTIAGNDLPAGTYALYTIPNANEWTIIISKNTELWGSMGYSADDDAFRFTVPVQQVSPAVETFTIDIANMNMSTAHLRLSWENTLVEIPIVAEVDSKVMAQIKEQVIDGKSENPGILFQAGSFLYEKGEDLGQALEWVSKSAETQAQYWVLHLKAKIQYELNQDEAAIATAQKSMALAKEANNPDYVRLNEKLIAEIKSK